MKTKLLLGLLISGLALSACRPANPKYETVVPPVKAVEVGAVLQKIDVTPRIDILVVIDDSLSMTNHQKTLSKNIEDFVKAFANNKLLDFHFGMVTIFDSVHFGKTVNGVTITDYNPLGKLLPLKNPYVKIDAKTLMKDVPVLDGPRFVTKSTDEYIEIIKRTLLVGEKPYPEYFEESFSPVIPALTDSQWANGPNKDFYRPDAFLVLIFITDGEDVSPGLTAEEFDQKLLDLKGQDPSKISKVGVLSPSYERKCPKDQNAQIAGPLKIEKFLNLNVLHKGQELSLCSADFGKQLANIGKNIVKKVGRRVIPVTGFPDFSPGQKFVVRYGTQEVPRGVYPHYESGWAYDNVHGEIQLGRDIVWTDQPPGTTLTIEYTPISGVKAANGHVKKIGGGGK